MNFLEQIIEQDLKNGRFEKGLHFRFPPEPNGFLHLGHVKSICLNFGLAKKYNGKCNLRFDDTNPDKENTLFVESIKKDIEWLGFNWDNEFYASNYFEQLYKWAIILVKKGLAYVDNDSSEEMNIKRGTLTTLGIESTYRNRSIDENLNLLERMKNGEFSEGHCVLRAKIDMSSPNIHLRDPVLYRIKHTPHHRTGTKWHIYPLYDFAHGQSDFIEQITHSICTLEFEAHRPLYEWFLENLDCELKPQQYEFARLNVTFTVLSKRLLSSLVNGNHVNGWDDPRMPTVAGMRRRGYSANSIKTFIDKVGVAKRDTLINIKLLEHCVREDLNITAPRVLGVVNPIKVILVNYPNDMEEEFVVDNRSIPFSKILYIESSDFMVDPPKKFYRLSVGKEVRLRYAYIIKCIDYKINNGLVEIYCSCDFNTRGGDSKDRKVKATIHWVSEKHSIRSEMRLYENLFKVEITDEKMMLDNLNPVSLSKSVGFVEPFVKTLNVGDTMQFERMGYFCIDSDSTLDKLVFNRTVSLRDTYSKTEH